MNYKACINYQIYNKYFVTYEAGNMRRIIRLLSAKLDRSAIMEYKRRMAVWLYEKAREDRLQLGRVLK